MSAPDPRLEQLRAWLASASTVALDLQSLRPASNDASFRRYFRVDRRDGGSLIAMDAPPPMEDCRPFVHAASVLGAAGLTVPTVRAQQLDAGMLLLDDLGDTTYLDALAVASPAHREALYQDAARALVALQAASLPGVFAEYDRELLTRELMLYPDWYLARHKQYVADDADRAVLRGAFDALLANNLAQPAVFVHRDYHSRNLMVVADGTRNPGVLDFQDAVHGPITYDLVSLLRDAYVDWPEEVEIDRAARYWGAARDAGLPVHSDFAEFYRDFEWMGLQRHLKVLGIFARLRHRDGKDRYLADMPRVLGYVRRVAGRYREFAALARLIDRVEARTAADGYTF